MKERDVVERMKALGTYREEYGETIKTYVKICGQLTRFERELARSGYRCTAETAQGVKKHPLISTLEALRRDKLRYESELGLTPAGAHRLRAEEPERKTGGLRLIGGGMR